jgi:hypothetical protein
MVFQNRELTGILGSMNWQEAEEDYKMSGFEIYTLY